MADCEIFAEIEKMSKGVWLDRNAIFLRCIKDCKIDYAAVISSMKTEIEERSKQCVHDLVLFENECNSVGCHLCLIKYNCKECSKKTQSNYKMFCSINSFSKEFLCGTCSRSVLFWVCDECEEMDCIC